MPSAVRALALCLLVLAVPGCGGSNNKGLIEVRWKFVAPDDPRLQNTVLLFGDDGTVAVQHRDPATGKRTTAFGWRYKLLAGDAAEFYDVPPEAHDWFGLSNQRVSLAIEIVKGEKVEGRNLTLTDAQGRVHRLTMTRE